MATPVSVLQQYPQLANDAEFMRLYRQLLDPRIQAGTNGRGLAADGSTLGLDLAKQLTDRAHALGMPADREVSRQGNDISVHAARTAYLKAGVFAGSAIAGGALLNTLGSAGAGTADAATLPSTSTTAASTSAATTPTIATGATPAATTVGTTTAPVVQSLSTVPYKKIIEAGLSALGTYLQGRAQNKAIDAQTQANTQAQAQIKAAQDQQVARIDRNQETQRQLYGPYTSLGASAAGTLASRMGLPPTSTPAPGMAPTTTLQPAMGSGLRPGTVSPPSGVQTAPAPGSLASASTGPPPPVASGIARIAQAAQTQTAQDQTQSGYVTMRDPVTGETGQVPPHQLAFYKAKGAEVVA